MEIDLLQETALENEKRLWRQRVSDWFPDLADTTYFVPPLHFNRVPQELQHVAGQSVAELQPTIDESSAKKDEGTHPGVSSASVTTEQREAARQPQRSQAQPDHGSHSQQRGRPQQRAQMATARAVHDEEARDDQAQQRVRKCLQKFADKKKEVMVVVTQLQFDHYLDKPCYAAAAQHFMRPAQLSRDMQRGDFDVLIIHRKHGIVAGEVKSVGSKSDAIPESELQTVIIRRVETACKQMRKAKEVLNHVVKDMLPIKIRTTLILTSVTSDQLKDALQSSLDACTKLCECLEASSAEEAVERCLCADHISHCLDKDDLTGVENWWEKTAQGGSQDQASPAGLSMEDYTELVARFCGPATTVKVPTISTRGPTVADIRAPGQGVALAGLQFTELALYPEQLKLVNDLPSSQFLTGPPGTGKSVVLYLVCCRWVREERRKVLLASTHREGRAACFCLEGQLQKFLTDADERARVSVRHFDLFKDGVDHAVKSLADEAEEGKLNLIVDEAGPHDKFPTFYEKLKEKVPELCLWAASVRMSVRPDELKETLLTMPLRSPFTVVEEVKQAGEIARKEVYNYSTRTTPAPTTGPIVEWLDHCGVPGHDKGLFPENCQKCGDNLADILIKKLQVGAQMENGLRYSDVLVVCRYPRDEVTDEAGRPSSACGLVLGLRARGIPVKVLRSTDPDQAVREVALAEGNYVTVTEPFAVMGLERSVVVASAHQKGYDHCNRLHSLSRCKSQLICFRSQKQGPKSDSDDDSSDSNGDRATSESERSTKRPRHT